MRGELAVNGVLEGITKTTTHFNDKRVLVEDAVDVLEQPTLVRGRGAGAGRLYSNGRNHK